MKLSRIYCSRGDILPPIPFQIGLNVILARVLERKDEKKDSHNLGKTLLIDLLDFCLLKELKKDFFMKKHPARFVGLVFFLELELPTGDYATIRRGVDEPSKISVKRHAERHQDFSTLAEEKWDHWRLPLQKAIGWLNSALSLRAFGTLNYRDGHSFFLRKQKDFSDVFELHKFNQGSDSYWKPVVAQVLGLDARANGPSGAWTAVDRKRDIRCSASHRARRGCAGSQLSSRPASPWPTRLPIRPLKKSPKSRSASFPRASNGWGPPGR